MAWVGWTLGLVTLLAPRPLGLTVVRVIAAAALGTAVLAVVSTDAVRSIAGLASAGTVAALVAAPETAAWMANGAAYGNERRFPLSHPWVVGWVAGPLAAGFLAATTVAGPLLLLHHQTALGLVAVSLAAVLARPLTRSLHALSTRWAIIVPGGLVVHDPLTLSNAVLLPRAFIADIRQDGTPDDESLDLRLGAKIGTLTVILNEAVSFGVVSRPGRRVELVPTKAVIVSASQPGALLREIAQRGLTRPASTRPRAGP